MHILGIDPGVARVGYGILEKNGDTLTHVAHGCIETSLEFSQSERLKIVSDEIARLIKIYTPELVGIEKLYFQKNVKTAMAVSEGRGVILLACEMHKLPILEFTPMQIKQAVVGYGNAEKRQVQEMVRMLLKLKEIPKPDDAADALAIAYCAARSIVPK